LELKFSFIIYLFLTFFALNCKDGNGINLLNSDKRIVAETKLLTIPEKNKTIVDLVKKFGPDISSTYEKAVCTELVIQILEKIQKLEDIDKKRIRIITNQNIQELLKNNSISLKEYISRSLKKELESQLTIKMRFAKETLCNFGLKLGDIVGL
jgi:hypothetical protein